MRKTKLRRVSPFIPITIPVTKGVLKEIKALAAKHGYDVPNMVGHMSLEYLDDIRLRELGQPGLLTALYGD